MKKLLFIALAAIMMSCTSGKPEQSSTSDTIFVDSVVVDTVFTDSL